MVYYFWMLHYAIIKKRYRQRHRNLSASADGLAFMCLLFLMLFLIIVFTDREMLWKLLINRRTLGSFAKAIFLLLTVFFIFFIPISLKKHKIKTVRKVIDKTRNLNSVHSAFYVGLYITLFTLALILMAISRTPI